MKIAVFDYMVSPRNPPGTCDIRVIEALREEHDITVFASELDLTENGGRPVAHVRVPTISHPKLVSFLLYFLRAWLAHRRMTRRGTRFHITQTTDCSSVDADVCYAHFCHRAFLLEVWPRVRARMSPRTLHTWANHAVRALIEANLVRRARVIVVPSEGLRRDLDRIYPGTAEKITVIRNTVDLTRFDRPPGFDRRALRQELATGEADTAFVFVALGHFERKGLPVLLEAMAAERFALEHARLWVVGGDPGLVASYRAVAERLGVADRVTFVGRADDVRPYLWAADAFAAPSHYEAFSLGLLEAAAAGLPLIATRISGSEELLDEFNGLEIDGSAASIATALRRFLELDSAQRAAMQLAARQSVEPLAPEHFAAAWRTLYASLAD